MKAFIKGTGLTASLIFLSFIAPVFYNGFGVTYTLIFSAIIFGSVITLFLISENIPDILVTGLTGLFFLLLLEFNIVEKFRTYESINMSFISYAGGLLASPVSIFIAAFITLYKSKWMSCFIKEEFILEKNFKNKLLIYTLITFLSFAYLVLPENAGISVPFFTLIQFAAFFYVIKDKKRLILFIPLFILSLNCFISANGIWRIPNFLISILLYGCIFTDFNFKNDSICFFARILYNTANAFKSFSVPFKWISELNSESAPVIKRVIIALLIALPCTVILILVLSNADMVFSLKTERFVTYISRALSFNVIYKLLFAFLASLFFFGIIYNSKASSLKEEKLQKPHLKGDLIIINIILSSVLLVYTLFVVIQFKYLFAQSTLPYGLTYTEYARKGFFELLGLTGVNIITILTVIKITKSYEGKWITLTKILCYYLLSVTVILLISSFYRMLLYTNDGGLTRLRLFVLGFLCFELIGLIITYIYIAKPKFNIVLIYTIIALTYYCVLNLVPCDSLIAKNQVDKYLAGSKEKINYVFTLSADAASQLDRLYENTDDIILREQIEKFINNATDSSIPDRWQRFNLSVNNAKGCK